jgi:ABC-type antimicrobial peptide transport system permease subunit
VLVGFVAALIISPLADWSLIVDPWSVTLAVASSVLVGVFFGSYPAPRASMLDPVEAISKIKRSDSINKPNRVNLRRAAMSGCA